MRREIDWNKADRELSWADWETAISNAAMYRRRGNRRHVTEICPKWLADRELRRARLIRKMLTKRR